MRPEVRDLALRTKGFLLESEGLLLFRLAQESAIHAPCLEIGSYCGRSTLFLAEGCRAAAGHPLISIDHHRGSEEQQPGEEYFDPELFEFLVDRISASVAEAARARAPSRLRLDSESVAAVARNRSTAPFARNPEARLLVEHNAEIPTCPEAPADPGIEIDPWPCGDLPAT